MAQSRDIATIQSQNVSVIPSADEWGTIYQMAKALVPTGFLPQSIKTPEQATAIMLRGRELNLPPMYALSNIVVVQGKPTANAELMLALVHRDHGTDAMWIEESTNDHCTVGYRVGKREKFYTFSMEDAKRANLLKNSVWNAYPAAMLRARAISATARMAFPGSIAGIYSPGELGDPVEVDEDGVVMSASISESTAVARDVAPGRAEPPAQGSIPKAVEANAQKPNTDAEREKLNASLHARLPHDLLHELAVELWKKPSFKDMTVKDMKSLDLFVRGEGAADPQSRFDAFVKQWEYENAEPDEDGVIEGQATLLPDEDELPTPASAFTR